MMFADLCIVLITFFLASLLKNKMEFPLGEVGTDIVIMPTLLAIWGGLLYYFGMYESFRTKQTSDILFIVAEAALAGCGIFGCFIFITKMHSVSRMQIVYSFLLAAVFISAEKVFLIKYLQYQRRKGFNTRNILIVGTGRKAKNIVNLINSHDEWGIKIIGIMDDISGKTKDGTLYGCKILGVLNDIPEIIHKNVVDEFIFAVPRSWLNKIEKMILYICEVEGIKVSVAADFFDYKLARAKYTLLDTLPLLTFVTTPDKVMQLLAKRLFDIILSLLALVLLLPVFAVTGIVIRLTSRGPVFFRQQRCGLNGRTFSLLKFRTMVANAEVRLKELLAFNEMDGPVFKMENDPRLTNVGKFLRKFSIDEIPQFWNVLKGDMSLVGPRPPLPDEVNYYEPWQRRRLSMRPGITCIWQANGRNRITDFEDWTKLDLQYINNWSLWLDFKIILKTILSVLRGSGAK
ncbi:MAG: sugar transferase [Candidatus Kuenenia stuttgartiensis]|nr:sugar transferase [Candidatus Kuenenia stuttgartiensis]